jgi:hypothetical protein
MSGRRIAALLAFQVVWLVLAFGAASGVTWPGIAAALAFLAWQWLVGAHRRALALVLGLAAAVGIALEWSLAASALVVYGTPQPSLGMAPLWLVALWLAFAATLPSLCTLLERWPLAGQAALGAVAGPASYAAGARLGALSFGEPAWQALVALGLAWAVLVPAATTLWRRLERQ